MTTTTDTRTVFQRLRDAGLIATPEPPPGFTYRAPTNMTGDRAQRYAENALAGEVDNVRTAAEGTRNDTLNRAAWKMGRLVDAGNLDAQHVIDTLSAAAASIGLGPREIAQTVARAVQDGTGPNQYQPTTSIAPVQSDDPLYADGPAPVALTPAGEAVAQADDPVELTDNGKYVLEHFPALDWHALWADERQEEWVVEPVIALGRSVVLYAPAKVGKSLLMLELCAGIAAGRPVLGVTPERPHTVLYVDFENSPRGDTRPRLEAMGYGPDDLDRLKVLSFPAMYPLNTAEGAAQLVAAVQCYGAEVVVIDTISRAVQGEENSNDTWLEFYNHTGIAMKRLGVAVVRLDHTGKDETKGMRGGSAKTGDVDAMWRLSGIDEMQFVLEADLGARMPLPETRLSLIRQATPHLRHILDESPLGRRNKVEEVRGALDELGVPADAGYPACQKALASTGLRFKSDTLREAIRWRKSASQNTHWQDDLS